MLSGAAQSAVHAENPVLLGAAGLLLTLLLLAGLLIGRRLRLTELGGTRRHQLTGQPPNVSGSGTNAHEWLSGGEDSSSEPDEQLVGRLMSCGGASSVGRSTPSWLPPTAPPPAGIGYERPSLYRQFSLQPLGTELRPRLVHRATNGELSAAERGKIGEGTSSSCSSTTSGEDELGSSLRRRDCRRYRQLAGRARSLDGSPPPPRRDRSAVELPPTPDERLQEPDQVDSVDGGGWLAGCGELEVACAYDAPTRKLTVHVLQAKDVPSRDRGGASNTQVRLVLLPGKKQRLRSRLQPGETPQFNEAFVFNKVDPDELRSVAVRLRLYGCERLRRERMVGEAVLACSDANLDQQTPLWISLQPRANMALPAGGSTGDTSSLCRSDSTSSTQSIHRGGVPELLLGLQYSATTGRLAAEVIKGSHFRVGSGGRAPDTYVRLHLLSSSGRELARSKTSVRRGQPNPLYKETFMFQIPLFQLSDVTLMVSVYNKRNMKKRDLIGWFGLGHNSSGEEERSHWSDARDARGVQICRWHLLCEE